jgi:hypothetical protein
MRIVGLNAATVEDITMMTSVLNAATALRKRASVTRRGLQLLTIFDSFLLRWLTGRQTCLMPYPLMNLFCRPSASSLQLKVSSEVSRDPITIRSLSAHFLARVSLTLLLTLIRRYPRVTPFLILLLFQLEGSFIPMIVAFLLENFRRWNERAFSKSHCHPSR